VGRVTHYAADLDIGFDSTLSAESVLDAESFP
jgi:hypothetical protein